MNAFSNVSRRRFLAGTLAATVMPALPAVSHGKPAKPSHATSEVSLQHGADRAQNIFDALKPFADKIARDIGNRPVLIKPNNVSVSNQLSATHVDALVGLIEFLHSIGKRQITIAESAASGPTIEGYEEYGYLPLQSKYGVELVDLDQQPFETIYVVNDQDIQPHAVRTSSMLLNRDHYIISAAVMKTHDRVVATLSLKNIVFGAPIKDEGFRWGRGRKPDAQNDKPIAHGGGFQGVNYNLFALAPRLHPDLAVIDGFTGMQGNGPVGGTPVEHGVAVASTDWLAADRVAVELMGIDFDRVGYLNYCAKAGYGEADLSRIAVRGASIADHRKSYRLHENIEKQMIWQTSS